jgi:hypothetical protein
MPSGSGDRWSEDYERGRPGYPTEILDVPGVPPTSTVLDLGNPDARFLDQIRETCERIAERMRAAVDGAGIDVCVVRAMQPRARRAVT